MAISLLTLRKNSLVYPNAIFSTTSSSKCVSAILDSNRTSDKGILERTSAEVPLTQSTNLVSVLDL